MERLTQTSDKGGVAFTFDLDVTCQPSEMKKILKIAEKLKYYEDLEEQGLLLRLPCKVGTKVWTIMCGINGMHPTIFKRDFELSMVEYFGISVFLTREEAEQKLKEMEGSHDGE